MRRLQSITNDENFIHGICTNCDRLRIRMPKLSTNICLHPINEWKMHETLMYRVYRARITNDPNFTGGIGVNCTLWLCATGPYVWKILNINKTLPCSFRLWRNGWWIKNLTENILGKHRHWSYVPDTLLW